MLILREEVKSFVSLGGLLASVAGFLASLWFYDTFLWNRNTTMYIPFLWGVTYVNPGTVINFVYYFSIGCLIVGLISAYSLGSQHRQNSESSTYAKQSLPKSDLRKKWLRQIVASSFGIAVSVLLAIYSFIFLYTFYSFNSTTSYFPWSWQVLYTNLSSVLNLFYAGFGISLFLIIGFGAALVVASAKSQ